MAEKEVRVPDIGDFEDVEIIEVLVSAGDELAAEDPLITLETDKASMDIPAPFAGKVTDLRVKSGDRVSQGDLIAMVDSADSADSADAAGEPDAAAGGAAAKTDADDGSAGDDDTGSARRDVNVPDIGDFADVEIIEVHVSAGDEVEAEDALLTLETDKAAMDVPAPDAGKVAEVYVAVGDKVSEGDRILALETTGGTKRESGRTDQKDTAQSDSPPSAEDTAAAPAPPAPAPQAAPKAPEGGLPPIDEKFFAAAHASPSVRKLARELGVDLGRVSGSGRKGRVVRDDVTAFVKSVMSGASATVPAAPAAGLPEVPRVDFAKYGEIETKPLSRIQKISGPRLQASWINLPHVTQFDEADITELEQRRKALKNAAAEQGAKLTPLAFFVKAAVMALEEFPAFNSSLDESGDNLVYKKYFHVGFAADTPNGLVVPVIRDADQKGLLEIARALGEMAASAREGKLSGEMMRGGSFTISSLGGIGGTAFTPIINAPEVAILGISRASMKPVWRDGEFHPRLMVPLSLSYDHRVIDGAAAARFTTFLGEVLADPDALIADSLK